MGMFWVGCRIYVGSPYFASLYLSFVEGFANYFSVYTFKPVFSLARAMHHAKKVCEEPVIV